MCNNTPQSSVVLVARHGIFAGELRHPGPELLAPGPHLGVRVQHLLEVLQLLGLGLDLLGEGDGLVYELHHLDEVLFTKAAAGEGGGAEPHSPRHCKEMGQNIIIMVTMLPRADVSLGTLFLLRVMNT